MKQCLKCGEIKDNIKFSYRMDGELNNWCKDCVLNKKIKSIPKITEQELDKVIYETQAMTAMEDKWERDKKKNAEICRIRREKYEKFLERVSKLPNKLQLTMKRKANPECAICRSSKSWPYAYSTGYPIWLCDKHKLEE